MTQCLIPLRISSGKNVHTHFSLFQQKVIPPGLSFVPRRISPPSWSQALSHASEDLDPGLHEWASAARPLGSIKPIGLFIAYVYKPCSFSHASGSGPKNL